MKKMTLALAGLLAFNIGIAAAAPITDLDTNQTAVGIMLHNTDPDGDSFYIEHKLSPKFTLGYESTDWDRHHDMDDIYGQVHLTDNLRAIIGSRDFDSDSKFYLGVGVNGPLSAQWDGFASFTAASNHKDLHVGAIYKAAHNIDLTISYRNFMPDEGSNRNGLGIGAAFKF